LFAHRLVWCYRRAEAKAEKKKAYPTDAEGQRENQWHNMENFRVDAVG
jgi:hypothetical protein